MLLAASLAMTVLELRTLWYDFDAPASLFWPAGVFLVLGLALLWVGRWFDRRNRR